MSEEKKKFARVIRIENLKTLKAYHYYCDSVETYGNMIIGKSRIGQWGAEEVSVILERTPDVFVNIDVPSEDEDLIAAIASMKKDDLDSVRNFMTTTGLLKDN